MPAVTFTVPVKLLDYGNQPRVGIEIVAAPIPAVKKDSEAAYGTEPEAPLTDESGLATLTLISLPGLWYRISGKGINAVRFAAYIPDPEDPRTGTVFPPETVIQFEDIMDESPTPGYSGVVWAGLSAYDVAVAEGFVGTEAEWLTSLEGLTAYEVAVAEGFVGDEVAWLASLVGPVGDDAYEVAVTEGFVGDRDAWLASLVGPQGDTAYEVAVAEGFVGTEAEWLETLIGPMSSLVEGTATTGAPGTDMDFTITGAPPVQTLNLTIPRGNTGNPSDYELRGTGSPEGVVTAPVGTYYTDTALTNGALRWAKKTGTGNTGWKVVSGDTGWRKVVGWTSAGVITGTMPTNLNAASGVAGGVFMRRANDQVQFSLVAGVAASASSIAGAIPDGFSSGQVPYPQALIAAYTSGSVLTTRTLQAGLITWTIPSPTSGDQFTIGSAYGSTASWLTSQAWPTTLPGTAA